jgi:alpha-glucosidase (family GH31 glycosyl hydrolase)
MVNSIGKVEIFDFADFNNKRAAMHRRKSQPIHAISRRKALKQFGAAGAAVLVTRGVFRGQSEEILIAGKPVEIIVSTLSASTARLQVLPIENGKTVAIPVDGALVNEGKALVNRRSPERFDPVRAGNLVVRFTADPPVLHIETGGGRTVQKLTMSKTDPGMSFRLSQGPLLGMGEGGPQFDRKGNTYRMRSGQGGYQLSTHGGRVPIQWLVGTDGWGMFIHHPLGTFDLTGEEGRLAPIADALPLDVYVVSSPDPGVILREYAAITGFAELPALWTLGYMQSHRTLAGPEEIMGVARTMREKRLPCDALIYLGTEFCPSGWNTRNGEFNWHEGNFPNPKAAIERLHEQHYKVVLHIVIEGRQLPGTVHEPCDPKNAVPSGRTPDNRWPQVRDVACYWPYHKPLFDVGVDGFWPDQGDGYDPASRLNRIRMYWEGSQLYRQNERPFALHRNGYAGMQRYGAFLWSGDVQSRWETLRTHVSVAVNTGLSGIPYWGTDIGGFIPTADYTGELHVRWFQFGSFCPSFRAHGRRWHLRLPWGWDGGDGGPAAESPNYTPAPEELRNPRVEPILRKYMELRYRLLPYTYTAVKECCETGLPIIRALWVHYPDDMTAVARGDQYLWGRDVLVSPVVEKGATGRHLYLPRGTWFDFWTEERIEGGKEIDRKVDLETMPLHVRAGAILPLGPIRQYVDETVDAPVTLLVYPGADGAAGLYEDDGRTFNYRKGEWMKVAMAWNDAQHRLTLQLAPNSRMLAPEKRTIEVRIAGERTAKSVVFEGRPLAIQM